MHFFKVTFSDKFSADKFLNSDEIQYKQLCYLHIAHQNLRVKIHSLYRIDRKSVV